MEPKAEAAWLHELERVVAQRAGQQVEQSYVAKLCHKGEDAILKKIGEEACEVVLAAKGQGKEALVYESADLLFHLIVLWQHQGISLEQVVAELQRRAGVSGLVEKASRNGG